MSETKSCSCGENHHGHMCMLRSNGKFEEIARITTSPAFYCFTCGAEANCKENLCEPAPIDK